MKKYAFILFCLFLSHTLTAQKEASNWYFGSRAGLDFNSNGAMPDPITTGELSTWEGCSSISTSEGELLFYTDGSIVWNRMNIPMTNGLDLMGDKSSTQSALVVPWPENDSLYIIFTIDDVGLNGGLDGLRYFVVNMNAALTLGEVDSTQKNIV